jgi:hypothetical protein
VEKEEEIHSGISRRRTQKRGEIGVAIENVFENNVFENKN